MKDKEAYLRHKAYSKEYNRRPEVKVMRTDNKEKKDVIREYQWLMCIKNPTKVQILRLEAIAEVLGRDLEEWRTEQQKESYHSNMDRYSSLEQKNKFSAKGNESEKPIKKELRKRNKAR